MNSDLISVIVPVYKVEAYLVRCVDSICRQTYQNLEIILVDDGSPDNCGGICENLAKKDSRITVFHKANGGLSDARNYGVEHSHGKYITFIDSDDYIAPDYVKYLYDLLKKHNADISACCMIETTGDQAAFCTNPALPAEQTLTNIEASNALLGNLYMVLVTAWGKLYRSDIVKKYPFPVGRKHEDEATTCKFYFEARKIAVGNPCLYAYYQNKDSIMHSIGDTFPEDQFWALGQRAQFYEQVGQRKLAMLAWEGLFWCYMADSQQYNGRCDSLLRDFSKGKNLFARTRLLLALYNKAPRIYSVCSAMWRWVIRMKATEK